jgi:hypothetical protein
VSVGNGLDLHRLAEAMLGSQFDHGDAGVLGFGGDSHGALQGGRSSCPALENVFFSRAKKRAVV